MHMSLPFQFILIDLINLCIGNIFYIYRQGGNIIFVGLNNDFYWRAMTTKYCGVSDLLKSLNFLQQETVCFSEILL